MKRIITIVVGLVFLLAFAQCNKEERENETLTNETIVTLNDQIQAQLDSLAGESVSEAQESLSEWLLSQEGVVSVTIEGNSIRILFADGTKGSVIFYDQTVTPDVDLTLIEDIIRHRGNSNQKTDVVGSQNAFIFDPFHDESAFNVPYGDEILNEGDAVSGVFSSMGFEVKHLMSDDCLVDNLKQITRYGFVQFITHGSPSSLVTKEHVIGNLNKHKKERKNGLVEISFATYRTALGFEMKGLFFSVTDKYFDALDGRFNNAIVFNSACDGFEQPDAPLKDAFIRKGANKYYGFNNAIWTEGSYFYSVPFTILMTQWRYSADDAYAYLINLKPKVYGYEGTTLVYTTELLSAGETDVCWYDASSIPDGAINSLFTVNANGGKVCFAHGNLQYQASTNTWRFAPNQYDHIGADNAYASSSYSGWIDLFCWGTSGWNSGAQEYQPYSQSTSYQSYYTGGSPNIDLTGEYADADWAYHNPISNGGQQPGLWRCLTHEEYIYMMENRVDASQKYAYACVNGVNGLVILPDLWSLPNGLNFTPQAGSWNTNSYTVEEWMRMESSGAVFLPTTGTRQGTSVFYVDGLGDYWASTANDAETGHSMSFFNGNVYPGDCRYRYLGTSVRPVHAF